MTNPNYLMLKKHFSFYKRYILKMTVVDWFCFIADLLILGSLISFTFYLGVEVGKAIGV